MLCLFDIRVEATNYSPLSAGLLLLISSKDPRRQESRWNLLLSISLLFMQLSPSAPSATAIQCLLLYPPRNDSSTRQLSLVSQQSPGSWLEVPTPASSLCVLPRMITASYFLSGFINFQPSNTNFSHFPRVIYFYWTSSYGFWFLDQTRADTHIQSILISFAIKLPQTLN